jgi:formate C-acetyltransferase
VHRAARLITEFFKRHDIPSEPMIIRRAKAFRHLLSNKSAIIYPDELIVGNVGAHRKSAIIQPELASVFMMEDLLWIDRRKTTPFRRSWPERLMLLRSVIPYWLTRNMTFRAFAGKRSRMLRYLASSRMPRFISS